MKFVLRSSQSSQVDSYWCMLTCGMASSLLTMVIAKKDSKSLDVNCRHSSVLTGMDRHKMSTAKKLFLRLVRVHNLFLANNDHDSAVAVREYIERVINYYIEVSTVIDRTYVQYAGVRINIGSELIDDALIGAHYRFVVMIVVS